MARLLLLARPLISARRSPELDGPGHDHQISVEMPEDLDLARWGSLSSRSSSVMAQAGGTRGGGSAEAFSMDAHSARSAASVVSIARSQRERRRVAPRHKKPDQVIGLAPDRLRPPPPESPWESP